LCVSLARTGEDGILAAMRSAAMISLVLAAGCMANDDTATFELSWTLVDSTATAVPTCDGYLLGDVMITAQHKDDVTMITGTCSAGTLTTEPLPVGTYYIELVLMGTRGDVAGKARTGGTLSDDGQHVVIAPQTFDVRPPLSGLRPIFLPYKQNARTTCAALGNPLIQVMMTPEGGDGVVSRIWSCDAADPTIDVPYGPFTVDGVMADRDTQAILATALTSPIPAVRGTAQVEMSFHVP
jgi:hypothetical protein